MESADYKKSFQLTPRKLFLFDGVGALVSAFLLGVVLVRLEYLIGIPTNTLYTLAAFPILFALFDLVCMRRKPTEQVRLLRVIAFANLSYCVLSLVLAFYHKDTVTSLGWTYVVVEVAIVSALAFIELKTSRAE